MEVSESKNRELIAELMSRRKEHCFPVNIRSAARRLSQDLLSVLFPHFSDDAGCDEQLLDGLIERVEQNLHEILASLAAVFPVPPQEIVRQFVDSLPQIHRALLADAKAIYHGDPAAVSADEVILSYPGFYAIAIHRAAHELYRLKFPILPRLLSELAHRETGVDIHPGATIGRSFFIDHGTGIVIGETAVIGNGVKLYQGVTLGALSVRKHLSSRKRHPTIGDNVVVYANATILGGETTIGNDTVVGGNAMLTESVPPFSVVGRNSVVRPRSAGSESDIEFNI